MLRNSVQKQDPGHSPGSPPPTPGCKGVVPAHLERAGQGGGEHQRVDEKSEGGGGVCVRVCVRAHILAVLEMEGRKQLCVWEGARCRMG